MRFDDIVIGSGLSGLAAAVRLAAAGRKVRILEARAQPGGKCGRISWNDYHFDTGPSVLTLPFVLEELFRDCGKKLEDYLEIQRLEVGCRYFWSDGTVFDAPGNLEDFRAAIQRQFPNELEGFDAFIDFGKKLWEVSGPIFLFNRFTPLSFLRANPFKLAKAMPALLPATLGEIHRRYFKDPKLIQLFDRYATYNGSDPMRTPSTFAVIAYVELAYGAWRCKGGMFSIVEALAKLLADLGGEISYNTAADKLTTNSSGDITGVRLTSGDILEASNIVINQDAITALTEGLVPEETPGSLATFYQGKEASVSGYVTLVANAVKNQHLACHNVFFCDDYTREFDQIFDGATALETPTIYVSVPAKEDPGLSLESGGEPWFVLVNAPSTDRYDEWQENYADNILSQLAERLPDFEVDQVQWKKTLSPRFFRDELKAWHGSLYGLSSNNMLTSFYRVPNVAKRKGLYFAGGSAHPGGGIPLVLLSGKIAASSLLKNAK